MTKRDFEAIALVISDLAADDPDRPLTAREVAEAFAGWLVQTNPRFDRERFLRACGVES